LEAGTIEALFQTQVADGIIGSFAITPSGADHGRARRLNPSTGLRPKGVPATPARAPEHSATAEGSALLS
jgi:hypothetical protein